MRRISTDGKTFAVLEDGIAQAEQVIGDTVGRRAFWRKARTI
jgi:hypothetical protein